MNRKTFQLLTENKIFFLDGGTGSNLIHSGMTSSDCPEKWILTHKDIFIELQKSFISAGSNIIYAPTFTSNELKLREYGLENEADSINKELVKLSQKAIELMHAEGKVFVAGDLTMTGVQVKPVGHFDIEDLIIVYKKQIESLVNAGVDLLIIETMMSLQETRAAVIAAREVCDLPIMATLSFEKDERTLYGTDAKTTAIVLEKLGVDAIGANCSTGPAGMAHIIRDMASVTSLPLIAKPNAGLPKLNADGSTSYDMNAEEFVREMSFVLDAGAQIIGGCCGTTPEYIALLHEKYSKCIPDTRSIDTNLRFLTSENRTLAFHLNSPFHIIGERINPTGKKKLQEELRNGQFDTICQFVKEQEEKGASILDINVGMSGIDEKKKMEEVIDAVLTETNLPLSIDSSDISVMEHALRRYPGRALVNSVSLEKDKLDKLLPLVKKYGAMFILLPLSEEGLPKSKEEKIEIINKILNRALELGLSSNDIIVDGLVTTIAANKNAARQTLDTIEYCYQHNLATTCGLSNISFGLPERGNINAAFLSLAISKGLTMAIANPSQKLLIDSCLATDLLLAKEGCDMKYIEAMNKSEATDCSIVKVTETISVLDRIKEAVMRGNKNGILKMTKEAHEEGNKPEDILNNALMPALTEVGNLFEKGKYFLPQLIGSAETMKIAVEYLEPFMITEVNGKSQETIVIATVEGDIHDIGKNLVALMLKNHGFRVCDLGKDVKTEKIVETAVNEKASIIALSALMTTTMQRMREVVEYKNKYAPDIKIMIGGAVITKEYATEIHADGYSRDAAEAVLVAKRLLNI